MNSVLNTVAAVSTPYGKGGVAMIRVSGNEAVQVCDKMFKRRNGIFLADTESNKAVYGDIYHEGEVIDDGIVVIYRAPNSFTGENVVEITCHGGILLSQLVLESVLINGAEMAEAGEFTKRAFLNGKLGFVGAEAVIDKIEAESKEKLKLSSAGSKNTLSRKLSELYDELKIILSSIYVFIDFPDEDLTDFTVDELKVKLNELVKNLTSLISTYRTGKAVNEGILTVIAGKPNTGKSSLLNTLTGENRAIVTDIAGTTRDTIEETVTVGRILLRLCDTAGIRDTDDTVEKMGVERALSKMSDAELIILVFDASEPLDANDKTLISKTVGQNVIAVINKTDLPVETDMELIKNTFADTVEISAVTGEGVDKLTNLIEGLYIEGTINYNETAVVANSRQYILLQRALELIKNALSAVTDGFTQDVAGLDLEQAMSVLAEIDGRAVTDDIVHEIFGRFCVGK
jgi:tRNA modification GTPase TrmE